VADFVPLETFPTVTAARLVVSALGASGIEGRIPNEFQADLNFPWAGGLTGVQVTVSADCLEDATRVLRELEAGARSLGSD
jgi:hypothetical protein